MLFSKLNHKCCRKRLINGFKIEYFNGKKWVWYNDGAIIKTHQYKYDSYDLERQIDFSPSFLASEIKVIIPRSERTNSAHGRYDFLVVPPTESSVVKPKKTDRATCDEVQEADGDAKRAITELGATYTLQSQWSEKWANPLLGSGFGFHNSKEAAEKREDFWIEINLQKPSQVQQVIIQKRGDFDLYKCEEGKQKDVIHRVRLDFQNEGVWSTYKDGVLLETGQDANDTANVERRIYIDEQFIANKVRVFFPSAETTGAGEGYISGRVDVVVVEQEEDSDETEDGTGEKDEDKGSYTNRAIMDFDSTSIQSSRYSNAWSGEKNIFLKSNTGFINKGSDFSNDFWLTVKFPANQYFNVASMILKKITHNCCTKRTLNGFTLQYLSHGKWHNYNNGEIIKTGQQPDDDVDLERVIEFTPFLAQQVRITIPRSERSHGSAQGRIDFLIDGPIKGTGKTTTTGTGGSGGSSNTTKTNTTGGSSNTTKTTTGGSTTTGGGSTTKGGKDTTTTSGGSTTTSGGSTTTSDGSTTKTTTSSDGSTTTTTTNTDGSTTTTTTTTGGTTTTTTSESGETTTTTDSTDQQSGESDDGTCSTTSSETSTDEDEGKTDVTVATTSGDNFNDTATKRAILDFGSTTDQSSSYSANW